MAPTRPHRQAGRPPATPAPHTGTQHTAPAPQLDDAVQHETPAPVSADVPGSAVQCAAAVPASVGVASAPASDGAVRHVAPAPASDGAVRCDVSDGAAQYAAWLAVLLGDVRDPANPYGRAALWARGQGCLPVPPAGLPGPDGLPGDRLVRALGPLFRRDLALAHAWSIGPLASAPVPHPAAALLGPAALLTAAGAVLRGATRIVEGLSRYEAAARQWRPVLATVFADLLACRSLTDAALRACPAPDRPDTGDGDGDGELLAAVVAYLVPQLAVELLGDLELVLNECGFDDHTVERRALARVVRDRAPAGAGPATTGAAQARIVRALNATGGPDRHEATPAPLHDTVTPGTATSGTAAAPGSTGAQSATPPPAAARLSSATATPPAAGTDPTGTALAPVGSGADAPAATPLPPAASGITDTDTDTGTGTGTGTGADADAADGAALVRIGRRLAAERRALRGAWACTAGHDVADPALRALADRQALLVLADRTTAAREAAARARDPFLAGAGWALLALGRITVRLGLPLPAGMPDAQPGVWDELARRAVHGTDEDLYAAGRSW